MKIKKQLITLKKIILLFLMLFLGTQYSFSQSKKLVKLIPKTEEIKIISYEILNSGDTVNRIDSKKQKTGKWLITKEAKYGEDGWMEFGVYDKNNKIGIWKTYTLEGQILSVENFKSGNKDGEAKYFDNGKLFCIGNYLALKSKYEYDTIMVEDPITNISKPIRIKTDVGFVRHGLWTYYKTGSNKIEKVIEFQADEIVYEKEYLTKTDSLFLESKKKKLPNYSKQEPEQVWHFDKSKKPVKYTDFPENTQSVTPNVRKR